MGKSYSAKDIEEYGCVLCKCTAATVLYRKADKLFVFDKNCDENKTYKLLTIMQDQFDYKH